MTDLRLERLGSVLSPPVSLPEYSAPAADETESFGSLLEQEITAGDGIRFSRHAQERIDSREITLGSGELQKLSDAVSKASKKGVRDSLVVMGSLAFIVSVPGRTVVTAMPVSEAAEHVFTNIDGAVIM
ncbi:MAG: TIGR02530 family flagellar biosynthesis protein [Clostridia bacterium]|nr:TIGR02530 family flagellar biosynthesis protein [Clostridia bacterium]MDR3643533.1 TIGR02530 family flagellar biosynthesis protein [Clostridia bacterium]